MSKNKALWLSGLIVAFMTASLAGNTGIPSALADSFGSSTTSGNGTLIEALTYDGKQKAKGEKATVPAWSWNFGYTFSQSTSSTDGVQTVDKTSELTGGVAWGGDVGLQLGGGLAYSATPSESLTAVGPNASVGYNFQLGAENSKKPKAKGSAKKVQDDEAAGASGDDSDFRPGVGLKLTGGLLTYTDNAAGALLRRAGRPAAAAAVSSIRQTSAAFEASLTPLEWLTVKGIYTRYTYNQDVASFIDRLNSAKRVTVRAATATMTGFPEDSSEADLTLSLLDSLDLDLAEVLSTDVVDGTLNHATKASLNYELTSDWKLGVGGEYDISPTNGNESLLVVTLSYEF